MKTRFKLLMFVLVVVVAVLCVAACDMGGGGGDTTTAPDTTAAPNTTEPTTTAAPVTTAPAGSVLPGSDEITLRTSAVTYNGSKTLQGYTVQGKVISTSKLAYTLSIIAVDPTTLEPLPGAVASADKPTEAGTYMITATFDWGPMASPEERQNYKVPAPIAKAYVISPAELKAGAVAFGAQDYETFYHPDLELDVAATDSVVVAPGKLSEGLVRNFALAKVDDAEGTNPVAVNGTVIENHGYYQVTITYAEEDGKNNYTAEDTISHTAIVYIRDLTDAKYQVKKVEEGDIVIDGLVEDAYNNTATITSKYQAPYTGDNAAALVNPYEFVGMTQIHKGANIASVPESSVTLKVLWGEETVEGAKVPYLYVVIDVTDPTPLARTAKYTAHRNAWVNDSVEFSYKLGGYSIPELPDGQDTYPTYSTILVDGREKTASEHGQNGVYNHTAVEAQKSMFFNSVVSATKTTATGYTVELKFLAKAESFVGTPGYDDFNRTAGEALTAGQFVFFCYQLNDLTALPEGFADAAAYDAQIDTFGMPKYKDDWTQTAQGPWATFESNASAFVYSSGNRNKTYLSTPGAGPAIFQLSASYAD